MMTKNKNKSEEMLFKQIIFNGIVSSSPQAIRRYSNCISSSLGASSGGGLSIAAFTRCATLVLCAGFTTA